MDDKLVLDCSTSPFKVQPCTSFVVDGWLENVTNFSSVKNLSTWSELIKDFPKLLPVSYG